MGDISIIARRLGDGHVQYGWSGNGGYFRNTGWRLLSWYTEPDKVEYLFSLGQTGLVGRPGSEKGGESLVMTHNLRNIPFELGTTEREIFSKIAFIDYGYFYDTDNEWYYIVPGPFRIKIPLLLIYNVTVGNDIEDEFGFLSEVERDFLKYLLLDYPKTDAAFSELLESEGGGLSVWNNVKDRDYMMHSFWESYQLLFKYFDDWVVVVTDEDKTYVNGFKLRKKGDEHIETIEW